MKINLSRDKLGQSNSEKIRVEDEKSKNEKTAEGDIEAKDVDIPQPAQVLESFPISEDLDKMHVLRKSFKLKRECPPYRESL